FPDDPTRWIPDTDGDGYNDEVDVFPSDPNEWADLDSDGVGDNADPDRDGDNYTNDEEITRGTNPNDPQDYPDDVPPQINITSPTVTDVATALVTLQGTVTDPVQAYSGIDR